MSNNPFEATTPVDTAADSGFHSPSQHSGATPVPLVILLATMIVFSLSGFMGSAFGILGIVLQSSLAEFQQNAMPPDQMEFQTKMNELQQDYMLINLIPVVINLFLAPVILGSSICGLMRVTWSRKVLSAALFVAVGFVILRSVLAAIVQMRTSEIMKEMPGLGPMADSMGMFVYIGIGVHVVIALAMVALYLWGAMYLRTDRIRAHFGEL